VTIPNGDHINHGPQDGGLDNVIPLKPLESDATPSAEAAPASEPFRLKKIDHRSDVSSDVLDMRIEEMLKPSFLNQFHQDDRVRAMARTIFEVAEIRLPSAVVDKQWATSAADNARRRRYRQQGREDEFTPDLTPLGRKILEHEQTLTEWDRRAAIRLAELINENGRAGAVMLLFEQTAAYDQTLLMHAVDRMRSTLSTAFKDEVIQSERLIRTMLLVDWPPPAEFSEQEMVTIQQMLADILKKESHDH